MRPKFTVGEIVLIQSVVRPDYDGESTVVSVIDNRHEAGGWCYEMSTVPSPILCLEVSLRKKHTPGEMTFDNLMASLSSPKLLTHQPQ